MPVLVLAAILIVLFVCLLLTVDRMLKVIKRERRRRESARRLAAATAQGEAQYKQRKTAERASGALTSVMPTIHDIDPRHVE